LLWRGHLRGVSLWADSQLRCLGVVALRFGQRVLEGLGIEGDGGLDEAVSALRRREVGCLLFAAQRLRGR